MMKINLESINFPFKKYVLASFAINLVAIILVLILQRRLPPQVPLFYGLAEGEEQLASPIALIVPNVLAILITLANILISLATKEDFLKKALILTGIAATFLATITTAKIIALVGSF